MQKYTILKLIGWAILAMLTLIIISIIEVAIYSYLVNPGHDMSFYESHANNSAPWISGIFGFIIFFLILRYWKRKGYPELPKLAILFPVIYMVLDLLIITLVGTVEWSSFALTYLLANGAKLIGSLAGSRV